MEYNRPTTGAALVGFHVDQDSRAEWSQWGGIEQKGSFESFVGQEVRVWQQGWDMLKVVFIVWLAGTS